MAKKFVLAKIGTGSSTRIVLWKEPKDGDDTLIAMKADVYNSLHWSFRRKRSCQYWKRYVIDKVSSDGFYYLIN
jgi:hypothetical protein